MSGIKRDCACPRARHVHGTEQAYISDMCRCDQCRAAHTQRMAWRRRMTAYGRDIAHLVPAIGSARRLEALAWLGWSCEAMARQLGWDPVILHRVRLQPRITETKAAAIAALYDEWWDRRPPESNKSERISAARTRALAARRGYLPPLAWDDDTINDAGHQPAAIEPDTEMDEVAVQRIMDGALHIGRNSRSRERIEAIRRLAASGNQDAAIGSRIGMAPCAVTQARLRAGIPAGVASNRKKAA